MTPPGLRAIGLSPWYNSGMRVLTQTSVFMLAGLAAAVWGQYPDTLWIPVTYYDYHADGSNPNFEPSGLTESDGGLSTGMVRTTLSSDRKPVLNTNRVYNDRVSDWYRPSGILSTGATFSIDPLDGRGTWTNLNNYLGRPNEWVGRNWSGTNSMANVVIYDSLPFRLTNIRTGMFIYENIEFLPIDGRGFGAEPDYYAPYNWHNDWDQNFSFAMELHRDFVYRDGLAFEFTGDDDVWGFVNGSLVMDLGGIHGPLNQVVQLTGQGLTQGQIYHFDFFFAERHVSVSELTLSANFLLGPYTVLALVPLTSPTWNRQPQVQWHPGEYSVTYTVEFSTSAAFSSVIQRSTTRDTFFTPSLLPIDTIYWRVRAENAAFTPAGSFVVLDASAPILIAYDPDPTQEVRPTLRWLRPPATDTAYRVQVSTSATFSGTVLDTVLRDTALSCATALPFSQVYWRVRTTAPGSAWSWVDAFV
jgi:fibro-slime domain-containing protein